MLLSCAACGWRGKELGYLGVLPTHGQVQQRVGGALKRYAWAESRVPPASWTAGPRHELAVGPMLPESPPACPKRAMY